MLETIVMLVGAVLREVVPLIEQAVNAKAEEHQAIIDRLNGALASLRAQPGVTRAGLAENDQVVDAMLVEAEPKKP